MEVWRNPPATKRDVAALRAVAAGEASETDQKVAFAFIQQVLGMKDDMSFRPHSERETAFAEGRRYVGLQMARLTNTTIPIDSLTTGDLND